jgi:hypothetical protein
MQFPFCESCMFGKQTKLSFSKQAQFQANQMLELIHFHIKGPLDPTFTDFQYFVILFDNFSRYTMEYILKHRSQTFNKFKA